MKYLLALHALAPVPLALSMQSGASPPPVSATLRDLEFGDLNFLHTTDTHGWHAGHLKQGLYSGDWGDYVTFANLLRDKLEAQGKDLLIVDTGDRIRGNGLYGADPVPGTWTNTILKQQALHALTTGNHELYYPNTTYFEYDYVVPEYKNDEYLVGNLLIKTEAEDLKPFSPVSVKKITTKKSRLNVTTIGLIHDFAVIKAQNTAAKVTPVDTVVKQKWFKDAINDSYVDVFVIVGHVPARALPGDRYTKNNRTDTEFKVVHDAIRNLTGSNSNKPIHFFGGDYHVRDYRKFDNRSAVLTSGMYFETVGFASINGLKANGGNGELKFSRRYINNNLLSFTHHTGKYGSDFVSDQGLEVTKLITEARAKLGLDVVQGCTPRNLWVSHVPEGHENNLFTWVSKEVFVNGEGPKDRAGKPRLMYMNSGSIRYDIYQGEFTTDTAWSICPFESPLVYIPDVPYELAKKIPANIGMLGLNEHTYDLEMLKPTHLRYLKEECPRFPGKGPAASQIFFDGNDPSTNKPPLGYVTTDDLGSDGDDTEHDPFLRCRSPRTVSGVNFDESKPPQKVDLVFNEYLVNKTLDQLIGHYELKDVIPYGPKQGEKQELRDFLLEWVRANWKKGGGEKPCSSVEASTSGDEVEEL